MKGRKALLTGLIVTGCVAGGFGLGGLAHDSSGLRPCTGAIVTVSDYAPVGCDVQPPQRLDVVYHMPALTDGAIEEVQSWCDESGGADLTGNGVPDENGEMTLVCEDVDY